MFDWESQSIWAVKEKRRNYQIGASKEVKRSKQQKEAEGVHWSQFKPNRAGENRQNTSLKTRKIHSLARKMMAREWARARGRVQKKGFASQEKEAASLNRIFNGRKNQISGSACQSG